MTQSRVPAVLDALVGVWSSSPELLGIVQDGPTPIQTSAAEVLSVGYDGGEDGTSSEGQFDPEGLAVEPKRESFSVNCLAGVLNGAGDIRAARLRAFDLLTAASGAITTDKTLGDVVLSASIDNVTLNQLQTPDGALVQILFTVACDAYTDL